MKSQKSRSASDSRLMLAVKRALDLHGDKLFTTFRVEGSAEFVSWTYADLKREVIKISEYLAESSAVGDRICLMLDHAGLTYASLLACILSGRVFVPLNLRQPSVRQKQAIELTQAVVLFADRVWHKTAQESFAHIKNLNIINLENSDFTALKPTDHSHLIPEPPASNEAQLPAYILFTSGSTGMPKGVVVSHANLFAYTHALLKTFEVHSSDRFTQQFETSFDLGIGEIFHAVLCGASLHPLRAFEFSFLQSYFSRARPTIWGGTPSMLSLARRYSKPGTTYSSVRLSFIMGERLTHEGAAFWHSICPGSRIFNLYGPTETTINVLYHEWNPADAPSVYGVPLGRAFGANQIELVGGDGKPVDDGQVGEIRVGGEQVTMGYLLEPDLEKTKMPLKPMADIYSTGDDGLIKNGVVYFIGRKDTQVKIRGFRLDLNEVEFYARQVLTEAQVVAFVAGPVDQPTLELLIDTLIDDVRLKSLMFILNQNLPSYGVPQKVRYTKSWPLSPHGKTDRLKIDPEFIDRFTQCLL